MNYRHHFHAGNFADVFKHIVLFGLLETLTRKERPLTYIDTHAGAGRYSLEEARSKKSGEAALGILKIADSPSHPFLISRYLALVRAENGSAAADPRIAVYPGSPSIAARMLRPQDRLILIEHHEEPHAQLRRQLGTDRRVALHRRDAYESLKALLPPATPRGLVLIDPPFEDAGEFRQLSRALPAALDRWREGVFCVWYPLKDRLSAQRFERALSKKASCALSLHFALDQSALTGPLRACGMLILRPPQGLPEVLSAPLQWLLDALSDQPARRLAIENFG